MSKHKKNGLQKSVASVFHNMDLPPEVQEAIVDSQETESAGPELPSKTAADVPESKNLPPQAKSKKAPAKPTPQEKSTLPPPPKCTHLPVYMPDPPPKQSWWSILINGRSPRP